MKLFRTDYPLTPSFNLLNQSIALLRQNIWPVFYLMFLPTLVLLVGSVLFGNYSRTLQEGSATFVWTTQATIGLTFLLGGLFWTLLSLPGALVMQLQAVRGKDPQAFECFKLGIRSLLPIIGAIILIELAVLGGLVLFIVPGLFAIRSFYLAQFYLIDQKLGPIQALKQSRADSKPNAGYIWGTIGVVILLGIAGSVVGSLPVAGTIISLVISLLFAFGPALRYEEIKNLKLPRVDK